MMEDLPFPQRHQWAETLHKAAQQPLAFFPRFPEVAARHEAWWRCQPCGGPLLIAPVNREPAQPITRGLERLQHPEDWLASRLSQLAQQDWNGDTFPTVRVDFGPVMLGGLLGAQVEFFSDTTWTHPMIADDWSNEPDWTISEDNPWWNLLPRLFAQLTAEAPGRYIACTPSLGGTADLLLNLRGSAQLCLDVLDQPERVRRAVEAVYPAWHRAMSMLWQHGLSSGAGLVNWVALWSNEPYVVLESDFNYLISPRIFQTLFLPDIIRQARTMGRAIFHLDGPGAARHMDALLAVPDIQAIQYVVGSGNDPFPWLPMLQKIQEHGRALQVSCAAADIPGLARQLNPVGLAFLTGDLTTTQEYHELYSLLQRMKR